MTIDLGYSPDSPDSPDSPVSPDSSNLGLRADFYAYENPESNLSPNVKNFNFEEAFSIGNAHISTIDHTDDGFEEFLGDAYKHKKQEKNHYFAMRIRGRLTIDKAGEYNFRSYVQDGDSFILLIDGIQVLFGSGSRSSGYVLGSIELDEGYHDIEVCYIGGRFNEEPDTRQCSLEWDGSGASGYSYSSVSASCFSGWDNPLYANTGRSIIYDVIKRSTEVDNPVEKEILPSSQDVGDTDISGAGVGSADAGRGLFVEYYTGEALRGFEDVGDFDFDLVSSGFTEVASTVDYGRGRRLGGDLKGTSFAARIRGQLIVQEAREYSFQIVSAGNFILLIDGHEVLSYGSHTNVRYYSSMPISLDAGSHDIEIRYFGEDVNRDDVLRLLWLSANGHFELIPSFNLESKLMEPELYPMGDGVVVNENDMNSPLVMSFLLKGAESGETFSYSVSDRRFELVASESNPNEVALRLKEGVELDYEAASTIKCLLFANGSLGTKIRREHEVVVGNEFEGLRANIFHSLHIDDGSSLLIRPEDLVLSLDDSALSFTSLELTNGGGVLTKNSDGSFLFSPYSSLSNDVSFSYEVADDFGNKFSGEVVVPVEGAEVEDSIDDLVLSVELVRDLSLREFVEGGAITDEDGSQSDSLYMSDSVNGDGSRKFSYGLVMRSDGEGLPVWTDFAVGDASEFRATLGRPVGIDGDLVARIYLDGELLAYYKFDELEQSYEVSLDISGGKTLRLEVEGDSSYEGEVSVIWGESRLMSYKQLEDTSDSGVEGTSDSGVDNRPNWLRLLEEGDLFGLASKNVNAPVLDLHEIDFIRSFSGREQLRFLMDVEDGSPASVLVDIDEFSGGETGEFYYRLGLDDFFSSDALSSEGVVEESGVFLFNLGAVEAGVTTRRVAARFLSDDAKAIRGSLSLDGTVLSPMASFIILLDGKVAKSYSLSTLQSGFDFNFVIPSDAKEVELAFESSLSGGKAPTAKISNLRLIDSSLAKEPEVLKVSEQSSIERVVLLDYQQLDLSQSEGVSADGCLLANCDEEGRGLFLGRDVETGEALMSFSEGFLLRGDKDGDGASVRFVGLSGDIFRTTVGFNYFDEDSSSLSAPYIVTIKAFDSLGVETNSKEILLDSFDDVVELELEMEGGSELVLSYTRTSSVGHSLIFGFPRMLDLASSVDTEGSSKTALWNQFNLLREADIAGQSELSFVKNISILDSLRLRQGEARLGIDLNLALKAIKGGADIFSFYTFDFDLDRLLYTLGEGGLSSVSTRVTEDGVVIRLHDDEGSYDAINLVGALSFTENEFLVWQERGAGSLFPMGKEDLLDYFAYGDFSRSFKLPKFFDGELFSLDNVKVSADKDEFGSGVILLSFIFRGVNDLERTRTVDISVSDADAVGSSKVLLALDEMRRGFDFETLNNYDHAEVDSSRKVSGKIDITNFERHGDSDDTLSSYDVKSDKLAGFDSLPKDTIYRLHETNKGTALSYELMDINGEVSKHRLMFEGYSSEQIKAKLPIDAISELTHDFSTLGVGLGDGENKRVERRLVASWFKEKRMNHPYNYGLLKTPTSRFNTLKNAATSRGREQYTDMTPLKAFQKVTERIYKQFVDKQLMPNEYALKADRLALHNLYEKIFVEDTMAAGGYWDTLAKDGRPIPLRGLCNGFSRLTAFINNAVGSEQAAEISALFENMYLAGEDINVNAHSSSNAIKNFNLGWQKKLISDYYYQMLEALTANHVRPLVDIYKTKSLDDYKIELSSARHLYKQERKEKDGVLVSTLADSNGYNLHNFDMIKTILSQEVGKFSQLRDGVAVERSYILGGFRHAVNIGFIKKNGKVTYYIDNPNDTEQKYFTDLDAGLKEYMTGMLANVPVTTENSKTYTENNGKYEFVDNKNLKNFRLFSVDSTKSKKDSFAKTNNFYDVKFLENFNINAYAGSELLREIFKNQDTHTMDLGSINFNRYYGETAVMNKEGSYDAYVPLYNNEIPCYDYANENIDLELFTHKVSYSLKGSVIELKLTPTVNSLFTENTYKVPEYTYKIELGVSKRKLSELLKSDTLDFKSLNKKQLEALETIGKLQQIISEYTSESHEALKAFNTKELELGDAAKGVEAKLIDELGKEHDGSANRNGRPILSEDDRRTLLKDEAFRREFISAYSSALNDIFSNRYNTYGDKYTDRYNDSVNEGAKLLKKIADSDGKTYSVDLSDFKLNDIDDVVLENMYRDLFKYKVSYSLVDNIIEVKFTPTVNSLLEGNDRIPEHSFDIDIGALGENVNFENLNPSDLSSEKREVLRTIDRLHQIISRPLGEVGLNFNLVEELGSAAAIQSRIGEALDKGEAITLSNNEKKTLLKDKAFHEGFVKTYKKAIASVLGLPASTETPTVDEINSFYEKIFSSDKEISLTADKVSSLHDSKFSTSNSLLGDTDGRYDIDYLDWQEPDLSLGAGQSERGVGLEHSVYDANVIVMVNGDEVTRNAAESLYGKYRGKAVIVQVNPETHEYRIFGDESLVSGRIRYLVVGHGNAVEGGRYTQVGRYTSAGLSLQLDRLHDGLGADGQMSRVSLVSCQLSVDSEEDVTGEGFGRELSLYLKDNGYATEVSARHTDLFVDSSGSKRYRLDGEDWTSRKASAKSIYSWGVDENGDTKLYRRVGNELYSVDLPDKEAIYDEFRGKEPIQKLGSDTVYLMKKIKQSVESSGFAMSDVEDFRFDDSLSKGEVLVFKVRLRDVSEEHEIRLNKEELSSPEAFSRELEASNNAAEMLEGSSNNVGGTEKVAGYASRAVGALQVLHGYASMIKAFQRGDVGSGMEALGINAYFTSSMLGLNEKLYTKLSKGIGSALESAAISGFEGVESVGELVGKSLAKVVSSIGGEGVDRLASYASRFGEMAAEIPIIDLAFMGWAISNDVKALKSSAKGYQHDAAVVDLSLDVALTSVVIGEVVIGLLVATGALAASGIGAPIAIVTAVILFARLVADAVARDMADYKHHGGSKALAFFVGIGDGIIETFEGLFVPNHAYGEEREKFVEEQHIRERGARGTDLRGLENVYSYSPLDDGEIGNDYDYTRLDFNFTEVAYDDDGYKEFNDDGTEKRRLSFQSLLTSNYDVNLSTGKVSVDRDVIIKDNVGEREQLETCFDSPYKKLLTSTEDSTPDPRDTGTQFYDTKNFYDVYRSVEKERLEYDLNNKDDVKTVYLGHSAFHYEAYAKTPEKESIRYYDAARTDPTVRVPFRAIEYSETVYGYRLSKDKGYFNIVGNDLDNNFIPPSFSDINQAGTQYNIDGGAGNDMVYLLGGHDYLFDGGDDSDVLNFSSFLDGYWKSATDFLEINLNDINSDSGSSYELEVFEDDVLTRRTTNIKARNYEYVIASDGNDKVIGSDLDDVVNLLSGYDTIVLSGSDMADFFIKTKSLPGNSDDSDDRSVLTVEMPEGEEPTNTYHIANGNSDDSDDRSVLTIEMPEDEEVINSDDHTIIELSNLYLTGNDIYIEDRVGYTYLYSDGDVLLKLSNDLFIKREGKNGVFWRPIDNIVFRTDNGFNFYIRFDEGKKEARFKLTSVNLSRYIKMVNEAGNTLTTDSFEEFFSSIISDKSEDETGYMFNHYANGLNLYFDMSDYKLDKFHGNDASNSFRITSGDFTVYGGKGHDNYIIENIDGSGNDNKFTVILREFEESSLSTNSKYSNGVSLIDVEFARDSREGDVSGGGDSSFDYGLGSYDCSIISKKDGLRYLSIAAYSSSPERGSLYTVDIALSELDQFIFTSEDGFSRVFLLEAESLSDNSLDYSKISSIKAVNYSVDLTAYFDHYSGVSTFDNSLHEASKFLYNPEGRKVIDLGMGRQEVHILKAKGDIAEVETVINLGEGDDRITLERGAGFIRFYNHSSNMSTATAKFSPVSDIGDETNLIVLHEASYNDILKEHISYRTLESSRVEMRLSIPDSGSDDMLYDVVFGARDNIEFVTREGLHFELVYKPSIYGDVLGDVDIKFLKLDLELYYKEHLELSLGKAGELSIDLNADPRLADITEVFGSKETGSVYEDEPLTEVMINGNDKDNSISGIKGAHNHLIGGKGDDHLIGRDRADHLVGGDGIDYLFGGAGADELEHVGDGFSFAIYQGDVSHQRGVAIVQTDELTREGRGFDAEGDRLTGVGGIVGTIYQDYIEDDSRGDDIIFGGAGNDFLVSLGGKDELLGGEGADYYQVYMHDLHAIDSDHEDSISISFSESDGKSHDHIRIMDGSIGELVLGRYENSLVLVFKEASAKHGGALVAGSRYLILKDIIGSSEADDFSISVRIDEESSSSVVIQGKDLIELAGRLTSGTNSFIFSYDGTSFSQGELTATDIANSDSSFAVKSLWKSDEDVSRELSDIERAAILYEDTDSIFAGGIELNSHGNNRFLSLPESMTNSRRTQFTLEFSFKSVKDTSQTLFHIMDDYDRGLSVDLYDDTFVLHVDNEKYLIDGLNTRDLLDGRHHTLSLNYDSVKGSIGIYLDGTLRDTLTGEFKVRGGDGSRFVSGIGLNESGEIDLSNSFSGNIYGVRIFDDLRTSEQIANNWHKTTVDVDEWRFEGDSQLDFLKSTDDAIENNAILTKFEDGVDDIDESSQARQVEKEDDFELVLPTKAFTGLSSQMIDGAGSDLSSSSSPRDVLTPSLAAITS